MKKRVIRNFTNDVGEIKLRDIQVFLELMAVGSVRDLSRRLGITPGQISKQIKSLELRLGIQLLNRSSQGVEATAEAVHILPDLEKIRDVYLKVTDGTHEKEQNEDILKFAASSFLSTHLLPKVFSEYSATHPHSRFRMIDLPPSQFVGAGLRGGFQLCVHMGELDWPRTWSSVQVGSIDWALYCRQEHPLSKRPTLSEILEFPFVYPVYWSEASIRFGDDHCPLPIRKRILGHETATATSAVEIIRYTDNIGFVPQLVARPLLQQKKLRPLTVPTWSTVSQKLYLSVKNDYVKQGTFALFQKIIEKELKRK